MPALVDDIAAAIRAALPVLWQDAAIKADFPNARDGKTNPAEGFFDEEADAEAAVEFRGNLFSGPPRRFTIDTQGLSWPDLETGVIPIAHLIDPELQVDANQITARIELDLEDQTGGYEVFG